MTTTTLAGKIAAASKDVGGKLSTDKKNTQQNYEYISADKILSVCGQALADQGVVVFPSITDEQVSAVEYANGRMRYDAAVRFVFTVADGTAQMELPFVGRGSDYLVPDKATYKAITSGHKYFLSKLLAIGAGNEDGEHEVEPQLAPAEVARSALRQAALPKLEPASSDVPSDNPFDDRDVEPEELKALRVEAYAIGAKLWPNRKRWDEVRRSNIAKLTGGRTQNINDLSADELRRLVDGLAQVQQQRGQVATNGH